MSVASIACESQNCMTVSIKKPNLRYLDEFLNLDCACDLIQWSLFPNAKEITESMAAYRAVRAHLWRRGWSPADRNITAVIVGDGSTPRTAALFAVRTAWQCHSVDPALSKKENWSFIDRLTIHRKPIEDCTFSGACRFVLIAVHSHADLQRSRDTIHTSSCPVIAMPCCVPQRLDCGDADEQFEDFGIASPHRTMKVWLST